MNLDSDVGASEVLANLSIQTIVLLALGLTVFRFLLLRFKSTNSDGTVEINSGARALAEILESLIIAGVLVFLIIRPFFVQAFFIPSESMEPTLMGHNQDSRDLSGGHSDSIHDHIFVNKLIYRFSEPKHDDIIVFKAPARADRNGNPPKENILIKRLIAIGPDKVEVKPGTTPSGESTYYVYVNDVKLNEPFIKEPMYNPQSGDAIFAVDHPLQLKPGELFVMGDNRNNSNDSRYWGTVERSRVIGRASLVFFPFNRIHILH
jgi:signal peptidase I